jgi:glycosyltransferase involved in cell wall biosynthesis
MSMDKKLHIVLVEPANSGGLIHFDYQLCTALSDAGADVTLIAGTEYELATLPHNFTVQRMLSLWKGFDEKPASADLNLRKRAVGKLYRNLRRVLRGGRMVAAWINLTVYLLRSRPDIIQFSILEHPFEFIFISYLKRRGYILGQICHEFEKREKKRLLSKLLNRLDSNAYHSFSKIFFLSEDTKRRFLASYNGISEQATIPIPHGNSEWLLRIQRPPEEVNLRTRYGIKDGERVALFFGLLSPSKGVEDLIDAFGLVLERCDAKLVVAGYPTKHFNVNAIKARLSELKISDNVIMDLRYIPLDEIGAIMEMATVVVYPYLSSTQSGALQTAYSFGRPVIATAVGGLPEVVEDGKSGFLVPVHSPEKMAEKIFTMLNDRSLATEMGSYARKLSVTRFSWNSIAGQMLAQYKDVLDRN